MAAPFDVRACRKLLGLTQKELGEKLDVSEREVRRWERKDKKHQVVPSSFFIRAMKRMAQEKEFGVTTEKLPTSVPTVRRKLPPTSFGIGIAPSSL